MVKPEYRDACVKATVLRNCAIRDALPHVLDGARTTATPEQKQAIDRHRKQMKPVRVASSR